MYLFVWDIHNTLGTYNDNAISEVTNRVLGAHNYSRRLTADDRIALWGRPWIDYFRRLVPGLEEREYRSLIRECFKITDRDQDSMRRYLTASPHAADVLEEVRRRDHTQIALSNSGERPVEMFLDVFDLYDFFDRVIAVDKRGGGNKRDALRDFLRDRKFEKLVLVGDSPEDVGLVSVGRALALPSVSYLYSESGRFPECEADYRIGDLREVLREL